MTVASLRCDRRYPLAFIYFIKRRATRPDIGDTCWLRRARHPRFLSLSSVPSLIIHFSLCVCVSLTKALSLRARTHSCVTVNHRKSERASPPAHFRKCFQNIAAVLNFKYAGEGCLRCCRESRSRRRRRRRFQLPVLLSEACRARVARSSQKLQAREVVSRCEFRIYTSRHRAA